MSAISNWAYSGPPMRERTSFARWSLPALMSQRGLSGTNEIITKKKRAGMVSAANIQRQPVWPYHESSSCWLVKSAGMLEAMAQLTTWASRTPILMVSWLMATKAPRVFAGVISLIYMGERLEARPMPRPPSQRKKTNVLNSLARAVPMAETVKKMDARISRRLRPNLSLRRPDMMAPTMQPTRALLMAHPTRLAFCSS